MFSEKIRSINMLRIFALLSVSYTHLDDQLAAEAAIQGFSAYWKQLGLPICFQDCISAQNDEALHTLVRLCSYDGTRSIGAFCKLDETDMLAIYQMANRT